MLRFTICIHLTMEPSSKQLLKHPSYLNLGQDSISWAQFIWDSSPTAQLVSAAASNSGCPCRQMYATQPEADARACGHATTAVLRRACCAWQTWLHQHCLPKAAAVHSAQRHHWAVCMTHALQASSPPFLLCRSASFAHMHWQVACWGYILLAVYTAW